MAEYVVLFPAKLVLRGPDAGTYSDDHHECFTASNDKEAEEKFKEICEKYDRPVRFCKLFKRVK